MSESTNEPGFGQTLEMIVSPSFIPALINALTDHAEQFTRQHCGFVRASVEAGEHQDTVLFHVYWVSKEASEHALACPKPREPDLVQRVQGFAVQAMRFHTFYVRGQILPHPGTCLIGPAAH